MFGYILGSIVTYYIGFYAYAIYNLYPYKLLKDKEKNIEKQNEYKIL